MIGTQLSVSRNIPFSSATILSSVQCTMKDFHHSMSAIHFVEGNISLLINSRRFNIKTAFPGVRILIIKIRRPDYMYLDNMNPHIMGISYWWDSMFIRTRCPEYNSKSWSPFDAIKNTCDLGIINLIIVSCSLLFTEYDTIKSELQGFDKFCGVVFQWNWVGKLYVCSVQACFSYSLLPGTPFTNMDWL